MSRKIVHLLCAGTAMAFTVPAMAQDAPGGGDEANRLEEIVVTARRESESLQNVPVSIQAVSGDMLEKLALTSVEDVSKLAPGLTLVNAGNSTAVTLRGVTWQPGSGTPATPIYFNEVPFDPGNVIVSMFDVGQVEVLRGPQGTSRGAPSISGAVTITTRKPDLQEFGGYAQGLYGEGRHIDLQAAFNAPIIKDVLALRLATNIENSEGNRIFSVHSDLRPRVRDRSYRATLLFKPTDNFWVQAMYQRRKTYTREFTQVAGTGSPGAPAVTLNPFVTLPAIPAGYNGPPLSVSDRKSVQDAPSIRPQHIDLLTINANLEVFGHNISYNFGKQINRSPRVYNASDQTNFVPGFEQYSEPFFPKVPEYHTHEIRISSITDPDRPFDYDIGWYEKFNDGITGINYNNYTPGAFGAPYSPGGAPGVAMTPNNLYRARTTYQLGIRQRFDNFYGNLRAHLDDRTEFTAGLAILRDHITLNTSSLTNDPLLATPLPLAFCSTPATYGNNYPGYCDTIRVTPDFTETSDNKYTYALYNFSASHKFTEDLLAYVATGNSFRTGLSSLGNDGLPSELTLPKPESAKSYEIGVKATISRKLRINAAIFQLDYKDQLTTLEGLRYYSSNQAAVKNANVSLYGNLDARVRGFEVEITANPIDHLTLGANLSYSKIKAKGGSLPCNDADVTLSATTPYAVCAVPQGQVLNTQAPFQATFNGAYEAPITNSLGAYFRFNVNFQGKNPGFGNFRDADGDFRKTSSYAIFDLYAGVNSNDKAWDVGIYAKNAFNKNVELSRVAKVNDVFAVYQASAGYDIIRTNPPREIGVKLRYAFGSR